MIDRDTAIQWSKDAGCHLMQLVLDREGTRGEPTIIASVEQLQSIMARAQNEAFEQAAKLCWDTGWNAAGNDEYQNACATLTEKIRALKQEASK